MKIEGKEIGAITMGITAKFIVIVFTDGTTSRLEGSKFKKVMNKQFKASLEAKLSKQFKEE